MQAPPMFEVQTRPNLVLALSELITSGQEINVTDMNLPISLRLIINLQ